MSIIQKLKHYKFVVLAIALVIAYFMYYQSTIPSVPESTPESPSPDTSSPSPSPPVAKEGYQNEMKPQHSSVQMNTIDLLPPAAKGGDTSGIAPTLVNMRNIPAARTITERVGKQRECNKNGYIVAGVQYKQPDVSTKKLDTNIPTICPDTFSRAVPY